MVVFETHNAKEYAVGSGVAPQTRMPMHTQGPLIPKMAVFETHHAK